MIKKTVSQIFNLIRALPGLVLFFLFVIFGSFLETQLKLPFPGIIISMLAFLTLLLVTKKQQASAWLQKSADTLLPLLPLFILPSCIGILNHLELVKSEFLVLFIAISIGLFVTLLITPWVFQIALKIFPEKS